MKLPVQAVIAGTLATLMLLAACDQREAEDKLRRAGQVANETSDKVKPDSQLFKGIVVGRSSEDELRRQAGRPELVWKASDGSKRLEYPRGPEGATSWIVRIGANGRVAAIDQVLTADNIARIRPGMSEDEVRQILGRPTQIARFELKKEDVWSWRWWEQPTETAFFNAHFGPDGRIVTTSRNEDPKRQR